MNTPEQPTEETATYDATPTFTKKDLTNLPEQPTDWKIEFENEFAGWWNNKTILTERIEDHISSLLLSQHDQLKTRYEGELLDKVKKLRKGSGSIVGRIYNNVVDDLVLALTKKE